MKPPCFYDIRTKEGKEISENIPNDKYPNWINGNVFYLEDKPTCIRCGKLHEYNAYQNFWYCPDPDCPPGRSRFPFNLAEEMIKIERQKKRNKKKKNISKINFKPLTEIKVKKIEEKTIIRYPEVLLFCYYPYPNHPKGCPNTYKCHFEKEAPYFSEVVEKNRFNHYYLVYINFNFAKYKTLREKENPEFFNSEARLKCLIYWQNSVKSLLKKKIKELILEQKGLFIAGCGSGMKIKGYPEYVYSMEIMGINVFSTLKLNKIPFELKPKNKIILCSLICSKNELNIKKQKRLDEGY